jgi:hypothetical protein
MASGNWSRRMQMSNDSPNSARMRFALALQQATDALQAGAGGGHRLEESAQRLAVLDGRVADDALDARLDLRAILHADRLEQRVVRRDVDFGIHHAFDVDAGRVFTVRIQVELAIQQWDRIQPRKPQLLRIPQVYVRVDERADRHAITVPQQRRACQLPTSSSASVRRTPAA